jgi:hypothetical protein
MVCWTCPRFLPLFSHLGLGTARERIAGTLAWFPEHVTMSLASSTDLIVVGIHDILHALQNPSPGFPLAPRTDSEVATLHNLSDVLLNRDATPAAPSRTPTLAPSAPSATTIAPPNAQPTEPPTSVPTIVEPHQTHEPPPPSPTTKRRTPDDAAPHVIPPDDNSPWIQVPTSRRPPTSNSPAEPVMRTPTPTPVIPSESPAKPLREPTPATVPTPPLRVPTPEIVPPPDPVTPTTPLPTRERKSRKSRRSRRLANKPRPNYGRHNKNPILLIKHTALLVCDPPPRDPHLLVPRNAETFVAFPAVYCAVHPDTQEEIDLQWLHVALKALHPDTGELVEYPALLKSSDGHLWDESCAEEAGCLAQGYKQNTGTNTIFVLHPSKIPKGREATYLRNVVADQPQKAQVRRVRWTAGGDRINYPFETSIKTAGLATAKLIFNSVISTKNGRFMTMNIKDFYLNTPVSRFEYMRIPVSLIPKAIFGQYNLGPLVQDGFVYVEIRKGMFGLPLAGRLANDKLVPYLAENGYHQCPHTPGLFKHDTRPVLFSLVVDDFGVQYVGKEHAQHLADVIAAKYKMTTDWTGKLYCGIALDWDYDNGTVDLSMPGYVEAALHRFMTPKPSKPQHAPSGRNKPVYGTAPQLTNPADETEPLDKDGTKCLQEIIGAFLYYARAIDSMMLVVLSSLGAAEANGTQATADAAQHLLNYAATHPDAIIRFHRCGMILQIHSNASYLSEAKARSRAGGIHFLGNKLPETIHPDDPPPPLNGAVHIVNIIMRNALASATEAEVGAYFHNAQDATTLRTALEFMGWPQPATPIQTDNSCADGIINDTVKQRHSKAIDMHFYWVRDRVRQG